MAAITTTNLTKRYSKFIAVNQVNLNVEAGAIYGFIGLNGAGKTTTMRLLLNMLKPTDGKAILLGQDVRRAPAAFWNQVGYLIETPHAYPHLTVAENLDLYGQLRLIPKTIRQHRITDLMDRLELTPYRNVPVTNLSLGNNQKIGLIKALIHRPRVLLLDEPTNGLDPQGLAVVRQLLTHLAQDEGVTVLISSHILGEMEKMFTAIGILDHGTLLRQQTRADYLTAATQHVALTFADATTTAQARQLLTTKQIAVTTTATTQLQLSDTRDTAAKLQLLLSHHLLPLDWHQEVESMAQYFLNIIHQEVANPC
ncbi:ABC transporter, ATP-binding protein [Lactobacillus zymae] [Lactiplantibacillus mudanjiangensis]|uniref:ABC transporter ATP-binding protein n=1 Tax=Lactiplantibacillus mudanjiangensis TaxID=1296538 RepID=UPI00101579E8|nr:ABC transporter ATP-binding protein [Lactiplantibacillus mudanjiangensis]VDG30830.1 ABC transporter, ATP-binding protein [Lactobacillus zymae] [Lactiplantibacillus mudanjiangensis]